MLLSGVLLCVCLCLCSCSCLVATVRSDGPYIQENSTVQCSTVLVVFGSMENPYSTVQLSARGHRFALRYSNVLYSAGSGLLSITFHNSQSLDTLDNEYKVRRSDGRPTAKTKKVDAVQYNCTVLYSTVSCCISTVSVIMDDGECTDGYTTHHDGVGDTM